MAQLNCLTPFHQTSVLEKSKILHEQSEWGGGIKLAFSLRHPDEGWDPGLSHQWWVFEA